MIALSRTCNLRDFPGCITVAQWQQALAVHAWETWLSEQHVRSREQTMCVNWSGCEFLAPGPSARYALRGELGIDNGIGRAIPAIYALCVLERTEAPVRFLTRAAQVLRAHGLLFLTFAFWDAEGPDCAEGCTDRLRIYDVASWKKLVAEARRAGLVTFGGMDWEYHGSYLEDHTLASLVLVRR